MAGSSLRHSTQSNPAYEPPKEGIGRGWRLIVAGLGLLALTSLSLRRVCKPDTAGVSEASFGVRHEQRGQVWYHCEPWIRHVFTD